MVLSPRGIISCVLLSLVCTPLLIAQSPGQVDSATIFARFSRYQSALSARDTASIGDFYADDAVSLLQNQPVRRGRQSIVQRWKQSLSNPILIEMTCDELSVSSGGQDAFQYGTFHIYTADTLRAPLASGKVMHLWRKQSGQWRISLEMDNFNSTPSQKPSVQKKQ